MGKLILVRHGESQWNLDNRFTGWVDIELTEKGRIDAFVAGTLLKGVPMQRAFTSVLRRAIDTTTEFLKGAEQPNIPIEYDAALNERMYGDLQGLNKAECAKEFGEAQVLLWRRSYDIAPPNGESLADTAKRTLPYFDTKIIPPAKAGETILVSAHGNSLRAIVMELDKLTGEEVVSLNIANAVPIIYEVDSKGGILSKKILLDEFEAASKALALERAP